MDALSLDQFVVFATVVDEGSFAAAARRMNLAQSAVTYAVQKLEDQSGVELFDRSAYRPVLTEAGKALLPRVRRVLADLEEYRLHAQRMTTGLEDELTVQFHPMAPPTVLARVLNDFKHEFPSVRVNALPVTRDVALEALRNGGADLALVHELVSIGEDLEHRISTRMNLVMAVSPNHPLASMQGEIPAEVLRDHSQLVMYGNLSDDEAHMVHGYGMDGVSLWRVMEFETLRDLLLAGAGWGAAPLSRVENDLAEGRLVQLRPENWGDSDGVKSVPLAVTRARNKSPGPAARWLFDRFGRC